MNTFTLLFLVIFVIATFAAIEVDESGVLILTDKNFDEALKENNLLLVEVSFIIYPIIYIL